MPTRTNPEPISILLAEDNPVLREGLESALLSHGYQVVAVEDGRAALEALAENDAPDLLVLDVRMPRMTGIELLEELRFEPHAAALPVILITALERGAIPALPLEDRKVEFLRKPFHLEELVERIEALGGARREQVESSGLVALTQ